MYLCTASLTSLALRKECRLKHSALKWLKKFSMLALSKQFPFLDILAFILYLLSKLLY